MKAKINTILNCLLVSVATSLASVGDVQITFKIMDDFGKPVPGATVGISLTRLKNPLDQLALENATQTQLHATTDKEGEAIVKSSSISPELYYSVNPMPGYYYTGGGEYKFRSVENGQWQPWNPTVELVLKPIVKPVPAYMKLMKLEIPKVGSSIGYDLTAGDWVKPYGKGSVSDFVFQLERKPDRVVRSGPYNREHKLFDATLNVSFSNDGNGIQSVLIKPHVGSELHMPRYAPEDGYQPQLVKHMYCDDPDKPMVSDTREDQNYFFRVRTVKKDGKIISALYGKIDGDLDFDVINSTTAIVVFEYSLNPEPNSRNMEFDPKRNLLK